MTLKSDYIIIGLLIVILLLGVNLYCNQKQLTTHTQSQFDRHADSIASIQTKVRAALMEQVRMQLSIDTLKRRKVSIITKYEPKKQAVDSADVDSLASIIRANLGLDSIQ